MQTTLHNLARQGAALMGEELFDKLGNLANEIAAEMAKPVMPERESLIDFDQEGAQDYVADEMERLAAGDIDVAWLQRRGTYQAAIIPAENYHPPGRCCCKNCPWDGGHTGGGHGQGT